MNRLAALICVSVPALLAVGLSACSSTSSSAVPSTASFTPLPILVAGSRYTYSGTFSEVVTQASPSPQQPNSKGTYKTSDVESVSAAPSSAPAPFDVHRDIRYAVTTVPTSGIQLQQRVIDSFESSTVTKTSQTIAQPKVVTTVTGIDQTANRIDGNGPYAYRDLSTTTYAQAHILFVFPLVMGTTNEPIARTATMVERSANKAGIVYSSHDLTTQYADDGSYVETGSIGPGETTVVNALGNGKANLVNKGTSDLRLTIGLPIGDPSGKFQIPVTRITQGVSQSFLAADWYPGGGAPPSPLATTVQTVKGPSALPANCGVTVPTANVQEIDSLSTALDVVAGKYATSLTQAFLSNGTAVCRIMSSKTLLYALDTGLPVRTTVDLFREGMTSKSTQ